MTIVRAEGLQFIEFNEQLADRGIGQERCEEEEHEPDAGLITRELNVIECVGNGRMRMGQSQ
jgi:hypothetical protein